MWPWLQAAVDTMTVFGSFAAVLLAACLNIAVVRWRQTPSPSTGALAWLRLRDDRS